MKRAAVNEAKFRNVRDRLRILLVLVVGCFFGWLVQARMGEE
jgi:hypothetical protein